jgi:hypothetical protein
MFDDQEFIRRLKSSDVGKTLVAEEIEAIAVRRRELAEELARSTAETTTRWSAYEPRIAEAVKVAVEAERASIRASEELDKLQAERMALSLQHGALRDRIENELRQTSNPAIEEALSWCEAQREELRNAAEINVSTIRGRDHVFSNTSSVRARLSDLIAFDEALNELKLVPDQTDVPAKIDELKCKIAPLAMVDETGPRKEPSHVAAAVFQKIKSVVGGAK